MERSRALSLVQPHLKQVRYEHTIRVVDTAIELAERYGEDKKKAELAAVFHDYAKYRDKTEMKRWIESEAFPKDLLSFHHELWHGPVGALLVKREVGITDQAILDAIYWHTTGRAHMSKLEKVVFLADYIEPGRDFPGVEQVREAAKQDLDQACRMALRNTITFLVNKNASVYPDTFHAYNHLVKRVD